MRCFIVGECASLSNEVKNHFVVNVVANTTTNQLGIPHHASYVWPALNQEIPLVLYPVHLFLLKCSPHPRLVKEINHPRHFKIAISNLYHFPHFKIYHLHHF